MLVNHSGWNEKAGAFSYDIFVDENKTDYEIHYEDGTIAHQSSPFQAVTADWNCDGDRYAQFGAWFDCDGRGEFLTPESMVWQLLFKNDYGPKVVSIPGIDIPEASKRPSLEKIISSGEQKASLREAERNRHSFERPPNTPDTPSR